MSKLEINNLTLRYDSRKTDGIQNISLNIFENEIFTILGPSGSGKSTFLKCLCSMLSPQEGTIKAHGEFSYSYVDQFPTLNLNQTVFENIESAILETVDSADQRAFQVRSIVAQLELTNEIDSKVEHISGGQRQRVIMAKALVSNPTHLLLDEPFANLDKNLRALIQEELFEFFRSKDITVIWVTHNTEEALIHSDRIAIFNYGNLIQLGKPEEIYNTPNSLFVAKFFGHTNAIASKVISEDSSELTVKIFNREFILPKPQEFKSRENQDILIIIHPEHLTYNPESKLKANIKNSFFKGSTTLLQLDFKGQKLWMNILSKHKKDIGAQVSFHIDCAHVHVLDEI